MDTKSNTIGPATKVPSAAIFVFALPFRFMRFPLAPRREALIGCRSVRLALEIRSGPLSGRTVHLEEGQALRVGRTKKADLQVPTDTQLSGAHFTVEPGRGGWRVRDLESSNGTFLNGERVTDARIAEGDRIRAGDTIFLVRLSADQPDEGAAAEIARAASLPLSPLSPEAARIQTILSAEAAPCFALVDAARDRRVTKILKHAGSEAASLYDGWQGEMLADYAPYLVRVAPGSPVLQALLAEGWGRRGVYLTSDRKFVDVRRHFRRFLMVKDDDTNEELYFRFYDPRVLRVFLGCCTPRQAGLFFEDIGAFLLEGEAPNTLLRFTSGEGGVSRAVLTLSP